MDKDRRYNTSEKGRRRYARYAASVKGVLNRVRQDARKKRQPEEILFTMEEMR